MAAGRFCKGLKSKNNAECSFLAGFGGFASDQDRGRCLGENGVAVIKDRDGGRRAEPVNQSRMITSIGSTPMTLFTKAPRLTVKAETYRSRSFT